MLLSIGESNSIKKVKMINQRVKHQNKSLWVPNFDFKSILSIRSTILYWIYGKCPWINNLSLATQCYNVVFHDVIKILVLKRNFRFKYIGSKISWSQPTDLKSIGTHEKTQFWVFAVFNIYSSEYQKMLWMNMAKFGFIWLNESCTQLFRYTT